jgi:hypothetical protein
MGRTGLADQGGIDRDYIGAYIGIDRGLDRD